MKLYQLTNSQPKSKMKASEGLSTGKYKFYTSSPIQSKYCEKAIYKNEALIFGTGGNPSVHYCNEPFSTSTDCLVLYGNNDKVNLELIYYYLFSNIHILENGFKGAGLKHISANYILNINIDLLNESVQNEILNKIKLIDKLISKKKEQLNKLDIAIKSRFIELFVETDEASEWSYHTIADVSNDMRTGPFGSALHHDEFVDSGVFVLGIDNAVENKFSYNRMRYITEEKYQQLKRYTVYPGDVIITIMGTVGHSAVIPADMPKAINTKHLACITPNVEMVNAQFLSCAFQIHPDIRTQLKKQCKGAIMAGLNLTIIKGLSFRIPPINLQNQFVEFYEQTDKSKFESKLYIKIIRKIERRVAYDKF